MSSLISHFSLPRSFSKPLSALILAASSCTSLITYAEQTKVNINIDQAEHHLAKVSIVLPSEQHGKLTVKLPTWRTGRYEILNLANGVRHFNAHDSRGQALAWTKLDKDTWQVATTDDKPVKISYQLYANQLGKRTRHIDDSHAFLDASAVVMYSDESREQEHLVSLQVPEGWQSVSGLASGDKPHQFIAPNYDVLVDSPIETGDLEVHDFAVDGRDYQLAIWGKGNYDSEQMVKDLTKLVRTGGHIWSSYPYERYVFMVHATSGARGATEHLNSTIIQRSRYSFSDRKDYLSFLSTASHEFFHTWNVKQYRPEGLVPYDYQGENYSNLLWLSEGSTSYFQNQLLFKAGIMTSKEFLEDLAKRVDRYIRKPGLDSQTVAETSFNKWIEQGGDYGHNHGVNIYSEGYLVSWLLDFDLIANTKGKKSYRDVHNELYRNYSIPKNFNEKDMLSVLQKVSGNSYQNWWQQHVHGHLAPNFDNLLANAGLKIVYGGKAKADAKLKAWSGLSTKTDSMGLKVTLVERDSPAWQAGMTTDDIIVAVDGLRMVDKDLSKRMKNFKPGQKITVSFFRRDQLVTREVTLFGLPKDKLKIVPVAKPTRKQKAFFKAWTGVEFPEAK